VLSGLEPDVTDRVISSPCSTPPWVGPPRPT